MAKPPAAGPLSAVDLSPSLSRERYESLLLDLQRRLAVIQQAYLFSERQAVLVFEGWDAAGKGGTIRRISAALDPRSFKVWPIGAPREYYQERHYLARFMERLPPNGSIAAFDRSWYGRVLVERVEGFAPKKRWKAAYREINDFERMLADDGARIVKIFFHISREEQRERFEKRLRDPLKRWKLSYEDFRNRGRWDAYVDAIDEMLERTSTDFAPWTVVPAEDKKHARIAAISLICDRLAEGMDLSPPVLDPRVIEAAREEFDLPDKFLDRLLDEARGRTS
ncbi:hypothetical protein LNKW23_24510 [Paralimibaculum aggregatum]|uniref:Polyphosphate kinase-2-related domain-containing protein n=1 Tax=Paralimibaculum aggregatum TaxID=3036245 RepID=A0ABQ6LIX7_9RHOB|nr:polyphosphate kinase 2 [Limibaculum sp. NKW23]GMG83238.1 hypothetical protein LNKW23_24510 [Limibaculum sp. NKW23]